MKKIRKAQQELVAKFFKNDKVYAVDFFIDRDEERLKIMVYEKYYNEFLNIKEYNGFGVKIQPV